MLHFRFSMPLHFMMLYGSVLLLMVFTLRLLLKKRLPGYVFPLLWGLVIVRFLVPFSLSSPLSVKAPGLLSAPAVTSVTVSAEAVAYNEPSTEYLSEDTEIASVTEDADTNDAIVTSMPGASATAGPRLTADTDFVISQSTENATDRSTVLSADPLPFFYRHDLLRPLLPVFYLSGVIVTALLLLLHRQRYVRRLRESLLVEHIETVNTLLREMQMAHILVFTNDEIASPLVCGLLSPRIYLPARMDFGNTEMLRHILAHETMHIRRRDNWVKTAMLATLCLNWFNPLVWLMAGCLASDLETACDEAVLRACREEDARQSYACSLLAMAVSASRSPLLYSAFSKTEVEKRIQRVLRYKRTSLFMLCTVSLLLTCSTVVCATGGQAPFDSYLSSTCYYGSPDSRWAFKVSLTRDIALGRNPGKRADDTILAVLKADDTGDPDLMAERIREALATEFHVEKNAFAPSYTLCLDSETEAEEYASWGLTRNENGFFLYQGSPVHSFADELNKIWQSNMNGSLDIVVHRDRYGCISTVVATTEDGTVVSLFSTPEEESDSSYDRTKHQ